MPPKPNPKQDPPSSTGAQAEKSGPFNLLNPFRLMAYSGFYIIPTIIDLLLTFNLSPFFSPSKFKDEWFARFWVFFGPKSRDVAGPKVVPLIHNNAAGVCLDIGPGTGEWLDLFARAANPDIKKIYGVEPNKGMHSELQANAARAGLKDVYEVIGCGAEELRTKGELQENSIDTIITVQCLCSIPTPELIIKELYPLLKPGGRWLVYEHVRTKYSRDFVYYWQKLINLVWPHFFNGCDICRPTDEWLLRSGEWEEVKLGFGEKEGPYDTMPHVIGTLTKKRFEPLQ